MYMEKSNENILRESLEDVWSRGSFLDSKEITDLNSSTLNFGLIKDKPNLFRYEMGGVLVYSSKARIAGESNYTETFSEKPQCKPFTAELKKILSEAPSEGNLKIDRQLYLEMPRYPAEPAFIPEFTLEIPKKCLRFNSKFEGGNLYKAIYMSDSTYNLVLESEKNQCLQWYYFEVKNLKLETITFKIINLGKFESLYNDGMKPLIKSSKSGSTWSRGGTCISYKSNSENQTYTLSFTYTFAFENDSVFFAYSYPYTYSELLTSLDHISEDHKSIARVDKICQTLCGNDCHMITITEDIESYIHFSEEFYYSRISAANRKLQRLRKLRKGCNNEQSEKKGVFITSRVHPGETVSSFMMQGILDFLLSQCKEAYVLRKNFVFKLIPMLNPDGVRYGRTRTSMLGVDLNRRWLAPHPVLHPTIFYTKKYLQMFSEMHECLLFADLHGHSTKRNVFLYGCNVKSSEMEKSKLNVFVKLFPYTLSKKNKLVSFKDSRFRMHKCKESTARIVVYKQLGIANSFTVEASFYGPSSLDFFRDPRSDFHMLPADLRGVGRDLCINCLNYINPLSLIRSLQNLTNCIRESMGLKVKSAEPEKAVLDMTLSSEKSGVQSDLLNNQEVWEKEVLADISYLSESSELSPSDNESYSEKSVFDSNTSSKKIIITKKNTTPQRLFKKRTSKATKAERNQVSKSPEAYFKIPGVSVFSFNLRTKSSGNIFNKTLSRAGVISKDQTKSPENLLKNKIQKPPISNLDATKKEYKQYKNLIRMKQGCGPTMNQLYQAWAKSKSNCLIRPAEKKEVPEVPMMFINRVPIHIVSHRKD